jgi:hypothetical protein
MGEKNSGFRIQDSGFMPRDRQISGYCQKCKRLNGEKGSKKVKNQRF